MESDKPLSRWQVFKRIAPFMTLGFAGLIASVLLPGPFDSTEGLAALGLSLLIIAIATLTPWRRVPRWTQALPVLLYLVVIALLRDATGGGASGLGALALIPVIWFAVYGTRYEMNITLVCIGAVFLIPVMFMSPDLYPPQEWVKGVLWVVIARAVGYTMQDRVSTTRTQAEELKASTELLEGVLRERQVAESALRASEQALISVSRLSKEIATSSDARKSTCEAAREVCNADFAILVEAAGTTHLKMTASAGIELPEMIFDLENESSGSGTVFTSGKRLFIPKAVGEPTIATRLVGLLGVRSLLFEPVLRDGTTVGVLTIGWRDEVLELDAQSDIAAGLLATEAGMAIERADLLKRLEGAALTDQLTGLPNRRAWDETLPGALAHAAEAGLPMAVAMFDLDHFKEFNDVRGHQAGDRLLVAAGAAWREHIREGDVLVRYGGEEFLLLMRDCKPGDVPGVVERIRRAAPEGVTCSAGFAVWKRGESADDILARADAALYMAKGTGRDNTSAYSAAMA